MPSGTNVMKIYRVAKEMFARAGRRLAILNRHFAAGFFLCADSITAPSETAAEGWEFSQWDDRKTRRILTVSREMNS